MRVAIGKHQVPIVLEPHMLVFRLDLREVPFVGLYRALPVFHPDDNADWHTIYVAQFDKLRMPLPTSILLQALWLLESLLNHQLRVVKHGFDRLSRHREESEVADNPANFFADDIGSGRGLIVSPEIVDAQLIEREVRADLLLICPHRLRPKARRQGDESVDSLRIVVLVLGHPIVRRSSTA